MLVTGGIVMIDQSWYKIGHSTLVVKQIQCISCLLEVSQKVNSPPKSK